jgi:polysaccharide biosynthesis/export protein
MFRTICVVTGLGACLALTAACGATRNMLGGGPGVPAASAPDARTLSASSDGAAAAPVIVDPRTADYVIGPEDTLDIFVWKNQELSRTVPVRPDGKISLPLVNDIQAAGLTVNQLRDQVTKKLNEFVPSPEVAVMVRDIHSVKVAVMGSVKMPGRYEIKTAATVLELIAMAQGFTEFADKEGVSVLRKNPDGTTERIEFRYGKAIKGEEKQNFFVRPGDVIVVP